MMEDKDEPGGTNSRPLQDTIAGTGPGIPDDALAPGEELGKAPTDEEVLAGRLSSSTPSRALP